MATRSRNSRSVSPPRKSKSNSPTMLASSPSKTPLHHTLPWPPNTRWDLAPICWPGSILPLRGRTMKEYDQQIADLEKENFHLKLRIYFLEEKVERSFPDDSIDLHKLNVQLDVEVESLKKELDQKHRLLEEALATLEKLEKNHKQELFSLKTRCQKEKNIFEKKVTSLEKELKGRPHSWAANSEEEEARRVSLEISELINLQDSTLIKEHILSLTKSLDEQDQSIRKARNDLEQQRQTIDILKEEMSSQTSIINVLQEQLDVKEKQIVQLSSRLDQKAGLVKSIDVAVHTALLKATLAAREGDKDGITEAREHLKSTLIKVFLEDPTQVQSTLETLKDKLLEDFVCLKEDLKNREDQIQKLQSEQSKREIEVLELQSNLKILRSSSGNNYEETKEIASHEISKLFEKIKAQDSLIDELEKRLKSLSETKDVEIAKLKKGCLENELSRQDCLQGIRQELDSNRAMLSEISGTTRKLSYELAKSVQGSLKVEQDHSKLEECVGRLDNLMESLSKNSEKIYSASESDQNSSLHQIKEINSEINSSIGQSLDSLDASQFTLDSLNARNNIAYDKPQSLQINWLSDSTDLESNNADLLNNNSSKDIIDSNQHQLDNLNSLLKTARTEVQKLQDKLHQRRAFESSNTDNEIVESSDNKWKRRSITEFGNTQNVLELKEEIALLVLKLQQMSGGSFQNLDSMTDENFNDGQFEDVTELLSKLANDATKENASNIDSLEESETNPFEPNANYASQLKVVPKENSEFDNQTSNRLWWTNPKSCSTPKATVGENSSDTDNLVLLLQPDPMYFINSSIKPIIPPQPVQNLQNDSSKALKPNESHVPQTKTNNQWSSDSDIWSEPDRDVSLQRIGVTEPRLNSDEPYFEVKTPTGHKETTTDTTATNIQRKSLIHKGPRTSKWRHKCETYLHSLVTLTRGLAIDLSHHRNFGNEILGKIPPNSGKDLVGLLKKHTNVMTDLEDRLEEVIYNNKRVQEILKERILANDLPDDSKMRENSRSSAEEITTKYGQLLDKLYSCREELSSRSDRITKLEQALIEHKSSRAQAETELAMTQKIVSDLQTQIELKDEELGVVVSKSKDQMKNKDSCNCWQWSIQRKLKAGLSEVDELKKKIERKEKFWEKPKEHSDIKVKTKDAKEISCSLHNEMKQKEDWWKRKVDESEKKVETIKIGQERQLRASEKTISKLHFDISAKECELVQFQKRVAQLKEELLKNITTISQLELDKAQLQSEVNSALAKLAEAEERCLWLQKELLVSNTDKMEAKDTIEQLKDNIKEKCRQKDYLEENLGQEQLLKERELQKVTLERDLYRNETERLKSRLEQILKTSSKNFGYKNWHKKELGFKENEDSSNKLLVSLMTEMRYLRNEIGHRSHANRRLRNKLRHYEEGMSTSEGSLSSIIASDSASSARTSTSFAFMTNKSDSSSYREILPSRNPQQNDMTIGSEFSNPSSLKLTLIHSNDDSANWSLKTSSWSGAEFQPSTPNNLSPGILNTRSQFSPDLGIESDAALRDHFTTASTKSDERSGDEWESCLPGRVSVTSTRCAPISFAQDLTELPKQIFLFNNVDLPKNINIIGKVEDYEMLKKIFEETLRTINKTSGRVKELISISAAFPHPTKKLQNNCLIELESNCQMIKSELEKGKQMIACFWLSSSEDYNGISNVIKEKIELQKELVETKFQLEKEMKKTTELSNYLMVTKKEKGEMEQVISWHLTKTCKMLAQAKENLRENFLEI